MGFLVPPLFYNFALLYIYYSWKLKVSCLAIPKRGWMKKGVDVLALDSLNALYAFTVYALVQF